MEQWVYLGRNAEWAAWRREHGRRVLEVERERARLWNGSSGIVKSLECQIEALDFEGSREPWEVFELSRNNVRSVSEEDACRASMAAGKKAEGDKDLAGRGRGSGRGSRSFSGKDRQEVVAGGLW